MGGAVARRDHTHSLEQLCHTPAIVLQQTAAAVVSRERAESEREAGETHCLVHGLLELLQQNFLISIHRFHIIKAWYVQGHMHVYMHTYIMHNSSYN